MEYLLIDGNNLAIRAAFANDYMTNSEGVASGAHYGFFNSLLNLKNRFPQCQMLVVWDSGSKRRKQETAEAAQTGMIKEGYKQNRKKTEPPKALADWWETGHHLKNALGKTGIPQVKMDGHEADDVIASYCELLKNNNKVIIVTSDKDYYQLLDDNVIVWDGMKEDYVTSSSFEEDYGIAPEQHVHVGALMGDTSDNIFGVPGWGEKTSIAAIQKEGSWESLIESLEKQFEDYEKQFPNLSDDEFDELANKLTPKGKPIYPEIYKGQPHLGLLKGFDTKKFKAPKRDLMALMFKDRVRLAYSLKKMDTDIEGLPAIEPVEQDKEKLLEYFAYYDIVSLVERIDALFD
jgi:5'-3' exonuclease